MTGPMRFLVVVPAWNAAGTIAGCLASIRRQVRPVRLAGLYIAVVDDDSTDGTASEALQAAHKLGLSGWTRVRKQPHWGGGLASLLAAHRLWRGLPDDTVVLQVDGDDELLGTDALMMLAGHYADPDVWLTYGQYQRVSDGALGPAGRYSKKVERAGSFRQAPWLASHLKTWRLGLWEALPRDVLLDPTTGEPWTFAVDRATMCPMLELARERYAPVTEPIYLYNDKSPANAFRLHAAEEARCVAAVAALPPLERLEKRPW